MSTGPMVDRFWLFALGGFAVPLGTAYATAAAVRWRASARGFALDASRRVLFALAVTLYLFMLVSGGLVLTSIRGIPPGIGALGVLAFLLAVYAGPLLLGTYLFGRSVSARLSATDSDESRTRLLGEVTALFVGLHLAAFPSVYAIAIVAS